MLGKKLVEVATTLRVDHCFRSCGLNVLGILGIKLY